MSARDLLLFTKTGWFMAAWCATFLLNATWAGSSGLTNTVGTIVTVGTWLVWLRVAILKVRPANEEA